MHRHNPVEESNEISTEASQGTTPAGYTVTSSTPSAKHKFSNRQPIGGLTRWTLLGFVLMILLAGCAAVPFDTPVSQEPTVHLENAANDTYRFEVFKAVIGPNVTVHRRSGDSHTFELGSATGFGSGSAREDSVTSIDLPDTARRYGTYTLAPGETKNLAIDIRQDEALLVVVYHEEDDAILGFHGVHCRPVYLGQFTLTVREEDAPDLDWRSGCGPK